MANENQINSQSLEPQRNVPEKGCFGGFSDNYLNQPSKQCPDCLGVGNGGWWRKRWEDKW